MPNICSFSPDPNILTQQKMNSHLALIYKHVCYVESVLSAGGSTPTGGTAGQTLVSNGPSTPSSFQTLFTKGTSTFNGNGATTVVTIPHGLGSTPSVVLLNNLNPLTQNLLNRTITFNATNITITYGVAPLNGENSIYHWVAYK